MFLLPGACIALLVATLWRRLGDARRAFVGGLVAFQAICWIGAEGLSLFGAVGFRGIAAYWVLATIALALLFWKARHSTVAWASCPCTASSTHRQDAHATADALIPAAIGLLLLFTLGIALGAAPNTFDSMTYHLPRIMHWLERGSVAHFPAHDLRLVALTPGAEFTILHLMALTGNDRLANLPQWFSYAGSIVAVSLLARDLGAARPGQWMAALFAATLPMAILQASSTQNDLVVAFLCLAFLHIAIASVGTDRPSWPLLLCCGATMGLAIHAKGTAYFFLAAAGLAWGVALLVRHRARALAPLAVAAALVALPNAPHAARNMAVLGTPLVPAQFDLQPARRDAGTLYSGVLRNAAIQLATPIEEWNAAVVHWVAQRLLLAGLDPDDPATTYRGERFALPAYWADEDYAGNPLHFILALALVPLLLARRRQQLLLVYTAAMVAPLLLIALLLKWQPWHGRFHVFMLLMAAPLAGLALESPRLRLPAAAVAMLLLGGAVPVTVAHGSRPLVAREGILQWPRRVEYYSKARSRMEEHIALSREIRALDVPEVGLIVGGSEFEYPLWAMRRGGVPRMPHVFVWNETTKLGARNTPGVLPRHVAVLGRFEVEGTRILPTVEWRRVAGGAHYTLIEIVGERPVPTEAEAPPGGP